MSETAPLVHFGADSQSFCAEPLAAISTTRRGDDLDGHHRLCISESGFEAATYVSKLTWTSTSHVSVTSEALDGKGDGRGQHYREFVQV